MPRRGRSPAVQLTDPELCAKVIEIVQAARGPTWICPVKCSADTAT